MTVWDPDGSRRPHRAHRVADIRFSHNARADDAPVSCICDWSGTVGEWAAHSGRVVKQAQNEALAPVTCRHGHELTKANSYVTPSRPGLRCRICQRAVMQRYTARKRMAA